MVLWSTVSLLIINKFWTRLSRSIIFLSLPLWRWQIIIFCNNWVQNCFIIWLPGLFLMNIFGKWSNLHFHTRVIARRRKAWFHLCMSRILFAAKHSRTKLRMPADHYLWAAICRSHGGLLANEKEQKFALHGVHVWYTIHVYATTALSLRINSCLQGRVDLTLDKYM